MLVQEVHAVAKEERLAPAMHSLRTMEAVLLKSPHPVQAVDPTEGHGPSRTAPHTVRRPPALTGQTTGPISILEEW